MADRLTPEQRHRCMAHIHSTGTRPERIVRRFLFACGMRYRIHAKWLPGTPDVVLRKYGAVIFINGCFWHGHEGCKYFRLPQTNHDFWQRKIARNQVRDARCKAQLEAMGWHVLTIWECELKPATRMAALTRLYVELNHLLLARYARPAYATDPVPEAQPLAAEAPVTYGHTKSDAPPK